VAWLTGAQEIGANRMIALTFRVEGQPDAKSSSAIRTAKGAPTAQPMIPTV
jgi:hypothetical protein